MKTKMNLVKKMISTLCIASLVASNVGYSVGAVSVAPFMASSKSLVDEVEELNRRLDNLKSNIMKLEDKIWNYKDAMCVNVGGRVVPQNKELDSALSTLASRIMEFRFYVDILKETNNTINEDSVVSLSIFVNKVSKDVEKYLNLSNSDLYMKWRSVKKDIFYNEKRMKEIASKMMDSEYVSPSVSRISRTNNNNNRNTNNHDVNNKNNRNTNNHDVNNNNNRNTNNHDVNNNIKNNLNDNDTVDIASNLVEIRDLVTELDNEQNILHRDAFIQSGKIKTIANKFTMAFSYGRRGFVSYRAHCFGIYSRIAGHIYSIDVTEQGKYVGQYPILNELYEAFQQLIDSYVFDNENLNQEQFKNKIHQNAAKVNGVLDRIVDLLGVE